VITEDDFLTWREHPVTKWVFDAIERGVEAQKSAWIDASWEAGKADPEMLIELRTRADAYRALNETTFGQWSSLHAAADA
jgi:hypothetical protein